MAECGGEGPWLLQSSAAHCGHCCGPTRLLLALQSAAWGPHSGCDACTPTGAGGSGEWDSGRRAGRAEQAFCLGSGESPEGRAASQAHLSRCVEKVVRVKTGFRSEGLLRRGTKLL